MTVWGGESPCVDSVHGQNWKTVLDWFGVITYPGKFPKDDILEDLFVFKGVTRLQTQLPNRTTQAMHTSFAVLQQTPGHGVTVGTVIPLWGLAQ